MRFVSFLVATAFVAAVLGAAHGQTSANQAPKSPAELARIIADGVTLARTLVNEPEVARAHSA